MGPLCCLHSVPLSPCSYCPPELHAGLINPTGIAATFAGHVCHPLQALLSFSENPHRAVEMGDS